MPTRPDLRDITSGVREAFAEADRETLLEILTFVVKEYVVDGPPPMLVHQVESLEDLKTLSFAQLIANLQTRFDHAELGLFAVDGDQVSVRIGGVMTPLLARNSAPAPAADLPRPQAGVRVIEAAAPVAPPRPQPSASVAQPAAPAASAQSPTTAPRPVAGLSLRGRPSDGGSPTPAAQAPATTAPAQSPASAAPAAPATGAQSPAPEPSDKGHGGDDASARFSLLELD